jgi:hypothetical protein
VIEHEEDFDPLSGDDLECIDATSSDSLETSLAQTALFYRQEAMDLQDKVNHLLSALREAASALETAGFQFSADKAWAVFNKSRGIK